MEWYRPKPAPTWIFTVRPPLDFAGHDASTQAISVRYRGDIEGGIAGVDYLRFPDDASVPSEEFGVAILDDTCGKPGEV